MFSFFLLTVDIINKRGTAVGTLLLTLTYSLPSVVGLLIFYLFPSTSVSDSPVGGIVNVTNVFCIQLWLTRDKTNGGWPECPQAQPVSNPPRGMACTPGLGMLEMPHPLILTSSQRSGCRFGFWFSVFLWFSLFPFLSSPRPSCAPCMCTPTRGASTGGFAPPCGMHAGTCMNDRCSVVPRVTLLE